jgi:hypothetical protein
MDTTPVMEDVRFPLATERHREPWRSRSNTPIGWIAGDLHDQHRGGAIAGQKACSWVPGSVLRPAPE